jgi:hypothetical protein
MSGETLTNQRCILNTKTIPSKLWSVASGNQTVSGSGGGQDQNQSIPDFVWGYKSIITGLGGFLLDCKKLTAIANSGWEGGGKVMGNLNK